MAFKPIQINSRPVTLHKAIIEPDFNDKTVLVEDTWEYVDMWLRRNNKKEALFFWEQTKGFYDATSALPKTSAPLTAYYCFLNAVKTLLIVKGRTHIGKHGVTGYNTGNKTALINEKVKFMVGGVLSELCYYFGETITAGGQIYTLKDIFYNLPFIHRAYNLTYENQPELFIPISNPVYVNKIEAGNREAWVCALILDEKYTSQNTMNKLPTTFEKDLGVSDKVLIRKKQRFTWSTSQADKAANLQRLNNYHKSVRKDIVYIHGTSRLWYIKRGGVNNLIDRNILTLTFSAMHRLSELSRYNPATLTKHFECQHNWLLSEFINNAPAQFIDAISSEITGKEFGRPGSRNIK